MKKFIITFLIILIFAIIVLPLIILIFGIQSKPLVTSGKKLDFEDVERVKQLMKENNPRRLRPGDIKSVSLTERDLNLFLDYALSQAPENQKLYAHINLLPNTADARFTYLLHENPFGGYLNVSLEFTPASDRIVILKLRIGALRIPGWLVNFVVGKVHKFLLRFEDYRNVMDLAHSVRDIKVGEKNISVVYQWQPDAIKRLRAQGRDFLMPADERERLIAYNQRLVGISRAMNGRTVSLTTFLQPLFQFAKERSISFGHPEAENRALILNLAAYSVERNLNKLLGDQDSWSNLRMGHLRLTLLGRDDLAKHFLVSAAITVSGGSGLANLAGIFKEMDDSRGGSGFSFADLAADRAGVRFGELAIGSSHKAKLLQQQMSNALREDDFIPRIDRLPEGIQELEFRRKYKDLDSATYRMVENEIERRIAACRIYHF